MRNTLRNILLTLTLTLLCNFLFSQQDERLAAQYFQNQEYEKAAEIYRQLYDIKSNPFYYTNYLQCIIELNDFKTAEKFIKKLKKKKPSHLKYYVDLGYVYQKGNQSSKSIHQYDGALKKLSANQRQISDLANAFLLRQLNDYAIQTYLKGRKLLNYSYTYGFELGNIYEIRGNYKEMINEYLNLLEFNNAYLSAVQQRLQQALSDDPSNNKNELLKTALLKRIQKNPDKRIYSEMLLWLSIQQKDFEMAFIQAKSLDTRFNEEGAPVFNLAGLCTSNKAFDIAIKAYNYLINLGEVNNFYLESKIRLLDVKYLKITSTQDFDQNELIELEKEYLSEINILGKNASTIMLLKNLAHIQAFYLDKTEDAGKLLKATINIPGATPQLRAECKIELADILLFSEDVWEATLLYSQVEKEFKNDPLGHKAKYKNAKLSYYIGEFEWAKAQLDVLKAATSKLIANDAMDLALLINDNIDIDSSDVGLKKFAKAGLYLYQNKDDLALKILDSIEMLSLTHPLLDEVLYKKSEIKIKKALYAEADSLLQKLINFYPYDILGDDALFKLAELNEYYLNNKNKAMELYQDMLVKYPGSLFTVEARKRFRQLRGDIVN